MVSNDRLQEGTVSMSVRADSAEDKISGEEIRQTWEVQNPMGILKKIRRVEDILPFLCPKKSRFSSLQSVIDFCIMQLETEVASNSGKKSLLFEN